MKVLFLNWRDIKNPRGGGAERVTHEICKRWVKEGHEVTLFTAGFPNSLAEETIDGVKIIRRGKQWTVHWHAFRYYQKNLKGKIDVVVDEVNTIPFFTPLYVKERKVVYFNQLAREVWFYESKFPINLIGFLFEPLYLQFYRGTKAMVISSSTKKDIARYGIKNTHIFPMAIEFDREQNYLVEKEKDLTLIFVGRLVRSKRPEEAIKTMAIVVKTIPEAKLWIVGSGTEKYLVSLKQLVTELNIQDSVKFFGFVKEEEKFTLMARAHLILVTSIKEGWGLIVTEANAVRTPAVVYNVDGLRDTVKNKVTGLIVPPQPAVVATGVIDLWKNKAEYEKYQDAAQADSQNYNWDRTAVVSLEIIK